MRQKPSQMLPGPRARLRHLLVVAAWVCLVTQISALTHFLLVEHVRCSEHGELIHAQDAHHSETPKAGPEHLSPQQLLTSSGEPDEHEHDHCLVGAEQRASSRSESSFLQLHAGQRHRETLSVAPSHVISASRTYAFAPKTSPPV